MLDSKYFELVRSVPSNGVAVYAPVDHPMVLFSKRSGRPLATLTLCAPPVRNSPTDAKTMLVPRRPVPGHEGRTAFQGLVSEDERDVEFVLGNLTPDYINFNLMRTESLPDRTDPGPEYGLNEVNELRPFGVFAVRADQKTHRKFVVVARRAESASGSTLVSVSEADSSGHECPIFPCVNPVANHPWAQDFADAEWREAPDALIVPWTQSNDASTRWRSAGRIEPGIGLPLNLESAFDLSPASTGLSFASASNVPTPISNRNERVPCGGRSVFSNSRSTGLETESISSNDRGSRSLSMRSSAPRVPQELLTGASAATLRGGAEHRDQIVFTGKEYDYERPSPPCVVVLSVSPGIRNAERRRYPTNEVVEEALSVARQAAYAPKKVYLETTCCICLEPSDGETPNSIVCTCGHACAHKTCLGSAKRCPICRSTIACVLPPNAIAG